MPPWDAEYNLCVVSRLWAGCCLLLWDAEYNRCVVLRFWAGCCLPLWDAEYNLRVVSRLWAGCRALIGCCAQKAQAPRPKGRTGRRFEGEACGKARGVRSKMGEFEGKLPNGLCADSSF